MAFTHNRRPLAEEEKSTDAAKARARAMELLAGQELSSGILYERLNRRFTEQTSAAVVAEMVEREYVNDERYAHTLAQELYERRGMGKKRIEQELRQRGISRETASECAEELDGDDVERIKNLLEIKFAGKFSDEKGRRRTFNALTRLGYGYSDIRSAMRSVDEEYADTDDQFSC